LQDFKIFRQNNKKKAKTKSTTKAPRHQGNFPACGRRFAAANGTKVIVAPVSNRRQY
jgi:hypothetical protein